VIATGAVLLAQFEIPAPPLIEAALIANEAGIPVIINPSPINPVFPWERFRTDYAIVNEAEAYEILGFPPSSSEQELIRDIMHQLRIANLIVTRGADETLVFRREGEILSLPTLPVLPIDTVGAGDAFAGCFAARLAQGEPLTDALRAANCAGALATLGAGAQNSIPDRERVDQHLVYLSTPNHQFS
jgi:ribokinase